MNIALWIVQIAVGAAFFMTGMLKAFQYEKVKASMPWAQDFSKGTVNFIGWVELLAVIGLILPWAIDVAPVLTPIAAVGLVIIMLLAAANHAKRQEKQAVGMNIVLLALALFIAIGRF